MATLQKTPEEEMTYRRRVAEFEVEFGMGSTIANVMASRSFRNDRIDLLYRRVALVQIVPPTLMLEMVELLREINNC